MPDLSQSVAEEGDSLMNLLAMPYSFLSQNLQRSALGLKETVVMETWGFTGQLVQDLPLYSGTLGAAFLLFRAYQVTANPNDLSLFLQILKACLVMLLLPPLGQYTLFPYLLGMSLLYVAELVYVLSALLPPSVLITLSSYIANELLYGIVGYLWACLFVNKYVGAETLSSTTIRQVTEEIIKEGRSMTKNEKSPLMFEWYGQRYWGTAHGLAGIMHVLMDVQLKPDEAEDVKGTLKYLINNRFPSGTTLLAKRIGEEIFLCIGSWGESFWRLVKLQQRWFGTVDCSSGWGSVMGSVAMHMFFSPFTELLDGTSISIGQKPSPAFCLTEATSYSQKEKCTEVIVLIPCLKAYVGKMAYLFLDMVDPSQARFPGYEL
ncbi:unnamed protein product [Brassica rapa]|uniref:Uncharacterized protein n=1 Tax=Brassica campestris TaxID=3711 RepID=A0A8D9HIG8_BRACM|nr:unnamed protein product [Brassica rapa]